MTALLDFFTCLIFGSLDSSEHLPLKVWFPVVHIILVVYGESSLQVTLTI